jgi:hypothetical protein
MPHTPLAKRSRSRRTKVGQARAVQEKGGLTLTRWLPIAALLWLILSIGPGRAEENQALIVHFRFGSTDLSRLFALEKKIEDALTRSNAGKFDGNEIATDGSDGFLYMYGPSADRLLQIVEPVLMTADFMRGAEVTRQYGPPGNGTREITAVLPSH